MDLSVYRERFDDYVDIYGDGSDRNSVEYVNCRIVRVWPFFALAGVDVTKLAEMMSDSDVWLYYDALIQWGAVIDVHRFIEKASVRFIMKNKELFIERGATEHELEIACSKKRRKRG